MIGVTLLGSTGSIGMSTLDVLSRHPERYRVVALTANTEVERLLEQCRRYRPQYAVVADANGAEALARKVRREQLDVEVLAGPAGLEQVASLDSADCVVAAIVGAAGLRSTLAAARAGKRVLLANKEALVMSGRLLMEAVRANNAQLLPIDSEHNAVFQCMPDRSFESLEEIGVRRILLTASGGPFRETPLEKLYAVTPEQACAHPNWDMGRKISVDSATMMNKGLEVIEARWLFNTPSARIQVVIHPQSIIHSMVEYVDGSVLCQMGNADMRIPIAHALAWPDRMSSGVQSLDLFEVGRLEFSPPDMGRFPCLRLAFEALDAGGTAPTILNAANEVAVQSFLQQRLAFLEIPKVIEQTMETVAPVEVDDLDVVYDADARAREAASQFIGLAAAEGR